jgi:hypothetical protein
MRMESKRYSERSGYLLAAHLAFKGFRSTSVTVLLVVSHFGKRLDSFVFIRTVNAAGLTS